MTIAEGLHLEGLQQGHEEGIRQGRVDVLAKLVVLKFGEVDTRHLEHIQTASIEALDRYIERILTAPTVEALFHGTT